MALKRIRLRRDTTANWLADDPVPGLGEGCWDTDEKTLRIGDGVTNHSALPLEIAPVAQPVKVQNVATYTLQVGDGGKLITLSDPDPIVITVPPITSVDIPVGAYVDLFQTGVGQLQIVAGAGVTLRVSGTSPNARAQYSRIALQHVEPDTWSLFGDLAP